MFTPEPMDLVSLVVLKEKVEAVVGKLLQLGIFHPVDWRRLNQKLEGLSPGQVERELAEWQALEGRIKQIQHFLCLAQVSPEEGPVLSLSEVKEKLSQVEAELAPCQERLRALTEEIKTKEDMLTHVTRSLPLPITPEKRYSFLEVHLGALPEKNLSLLRRNLSGIPHVFFPVGQETSRPVFLLVGLKRDQSLFSSLLREVGWEKVDYQAEEIALPRAVKEKLKEEVDSLRRKQEELKEEIRQLSLKWIRELNRLCFSVALKKGLLTARKYMLLTEKTGLLIGWVPSREASRVSREVKLLSPVFSLEKIAAEKTGVAREEIPVRLRHPSLLKPFELLVKSYGLPCYGTVDPTVFLAIAFLLMFGIMFGDVGHGLLLGLAGLFLWRNRQPTWQPTGVLLLYCGVSATIFGFLFGSVFGRESFPAIWSRPLGNITGLFQVSLAFGVGLISLGIGLNVVNAFKSREYYRMFFDKAGLVSGLIYWTAIVISVRWLVAKIPVSPLAAFVLGSGFFLLFLGPFLSLARQPRKHSFLETFMESVIGLLEVGMGYLANTVSFIRVAAFALAHTGLFLAVFELTRVVGPGHRILPGIILVGGNILIVFLEGLVVTIQSLRLNYYEFFSRFFVPSNQEYRPLTWT
ncbi:MAG: hypothetical protein NC911_04465 [Candidatus Omnitrophica bacterium]|nr:hypothetical protein [Candidatus Omnitrophota bacterium]